MIGSGLWWFCTARKWIAAQLNDITVTGFVPLSPWSSNLAISSPLFRDKERQLIGGLYLLFYILAIFNAHGDFIVLPHWVTWLLKPLPNITVTLSWLCADYSFYPSNVDCLDRKRLVSLGWLDREPNSRSTERGGISIRSWCWHSGST